MTDRDEPNGLRAARIARGWSQAEAARELAALAMARGTAVAGAGSLKTLLSRWENGHSLPDPQYRSLLADLYDRSITELGLTGSEASEPAGRDDLLAALATATAASSGSGLSLWRQQLALARDLDDELGVAGSGELVRAHVEHLSELLVHTVAKTARTEVAGLLSAAAALGGAQALDRSRHEQAWRLYDQARMAAVVADQPADEAVALAGQAAVLVDAGEPGTAVQLLEQASPVPDEAAQARLDGAMAIATAAIGDQQSSRLAIAAAERRLRRRVDLVDRRDGPAVELVDLHRWHGRALVTLGDAGAVEPLQRALEAGPRSTRHRAAVHADLALSLHDARPEEAATHARTARRLAAGIGSERIPARLARLRSEP